LTQTDGFTNSNFAEAEIKSAMREAADDVYVLMDRSKVDQRALVRFATLKEVGEIISDGPWEPPWPGILKTAGVRLALATTAVRPAP
jgi:DeoR family transcriptional regulator of aga operon